MRVLGSHLHLAFFEELFLRHFCHSTMVKQCKKRVVLIGGEEADALLQALLSSPATASLSSSPSFRWASKCLHVTWSKTQHNVKYSSSFSFLSTVHALLSVDGKTCFLPCLPDPISLSPKGKQRQLNPHIDPYFTAYNQDHYPDVSSDSGEAMTSNF